MEVLYGQKHLASHCLVIEVHNLPLLLMVGTDWVKNIRTNEVKWDANVNASTRFAINSEWQYFGKAGTTYFTANGTRQVILGDNGHWDYLNSQRNLNWREFTSQVNELKPMLDATATGSLIAVYGLAAYASGATGGLGFTYTSAGSGFADFSIQMFYNKGDIYKVNWTSMGAAIFLKSPLTGGILASGGEFTLEKGFENSLFKEKAFESFLFESTINSLTNKFGEAGSNSILKYNGPGSNFYQFKAGVLSNIGPYFLGNGYLKTEINYQNDQRNGGNK
ncbi:hypothetical protein [Solitalea canadensis]|uniref:hypothetical protein n=1 Tax=Solitalea canadensis TaxID=995 RepID=UPI0012FABBB7|nr:hypothetical protein [Solitalea canadensis]